MKTKEKTELLEAVNTVKSAVESLLENQDILLSEVRELQTAEWTLKQHLGFAAQADDNGCPAHYLPYVLSNDKRAWKRNPEDV